MESRNLYIRILFGINMLNNLSNKFSSYFYFIFRVLVGLFFLLHGIQKLFSGNFAINLIGIAGIIEFLAGILIILGLWTRFAALIAGITMIVAYFYVHFPGGFNPLTNGGELALMYLVAFLVLFSYGAGKWGIDRS